MTLSNLELNILGCIPIGRRGVKGLEIAKRVNIDVVFIYSILYGLERNGLIESYQDDFQDPNRGGCRARYYRITEDGTLEIEKHKSAFANNSLSLDSI